jgi:hypothetical protein
MQSTLEIPTFTSAASLWVGVWSKAQDFRKILEIQGFCVEPGASNMIAQPDFMPITPSSELWLLDITIRDLMFLEHKVNRFLVFDRIQQLGLSLCPSEIGPRLRLFLGRKQNRMPKLHICMKGIMCDDGYRRTFLIEDAGSGPSLGSELCSPDSYFNKDDRLICCQAVQ